MNSEGKIPKPSSARNFAASQSATPSDFGLRTWFGFRTSEFGLKTASTTLAALGFAFALGAGEAKPAFENNFEKEKPGGVPEGFLVIDGGFAVKEEGGNKFLELPGDPLDTFGVMFGPAQLDGVAVSARIRSESKGRRVPAFGVSLNGVGGYRLQFSGNKRALEIFRADEPQTSVPFTWESGSWLDLKLQVRKVKDGEWAVEGKAWKHGAPEPKEWTITLKAAEAPPEGRPAIWGNPFAGTPIQFDDLRVAPIGK